MFSSLTKQVSSCSSEQQQTQHRRQSVCQQAPLTCRKYLSAITSWHPSQAWPSHCKSSMVNCLKNHQKKVPVNILFGCRRSVIQESDFLVFYNFHELPSNGWIVHFFIWQIQIRNSLHSVSHVWQKKIIYSNVSCYINISWTRKCSPLIWKTNPTLFPQVLFGGKLLPICNAYRSEKGPPSPYLHFDKKGCNYIKK